MQAESLGVTERPPAGAAGSSSNVLTGIRNSKSDNPPLCGDGVLIFQLLTRKAHAEEVNAVLFDATGPLQVSRTVPAGRDIRALSFCSESGMSTDELRLQLLADLERIPDGYTMKELDQRKRSLVLLLYPDNASTLAQNAALAAQARRAYDAVCNAYEAAKNKEWENKSREIVRPSGEAKCLQETLGLFVGVLCQLLRSIMMQSMLSTGHESGHLWQCRASS